MQDHASHRFEPGGGSVPPPLPHRRVAGPLLAAGLGIWTGLLVLVAVPLFIWYGCRIEPRSGQIAVLIRKTGTDLPNGQIIAESPDQKGIQLDVLAEGRYFRNPYTWGWTLHKIVDIPAGRLGVKTRLFGDDLPSGRIIAAAATKGIEADILRPGKYRVNPYAYRVELFDAVAIRPGHVGVITSLTGDDVLSGDIDPAVRNAFLVTEGRKGVIPRVLDPGTYYLNPYIYNVVEVNLQSQRFEMSGADVITFLTMDGFTVTVEGTIEYAVERSHAALLTHRVGDMDDIMQKVVLPRARGFSRIEGSKHPAIDFIVGETRQQFQRNLEEHLRLRCDPYGVGIKSVLVRRILVPDEIASINRDREVAVQDARKYEQQIEQARSKAELTKQEMLAEQNRERVEADTARIRAVINAQEDQAVRVVAARKELEVSRLDREAATFRAEAVMRTAEGDRDAVRARNTADAAVLAGRVKAFGSGMEYARYAFYEKLAPRIESILSSDGAQALGGLFLPFLPDRSSAGREVRK